MPLRCAQIAIAGCMYLTQTPTRDDSESGSRNGIEASISDFCDRRSVVQLRSPATLGVFAVRAAGMYR